MHKISFLIVVITSIAFSQTSGTWTEINVASPPPGTHVHQMVNYQNNQMFMWGGSSGSNESFVYNNNTLTWTQLETTNKPSPRIAHAMAKVNDDRILVYSGNSDPVDHWLFDISSNSWTELTPANSSTYYSEASMVGLKDDMVLLFGGTSGGGPGSGDETWVFDYVDDNSYSWTKLDIANPPPKRFAHQLARIDNNKALMFGGSDENDNSLNDTWIFDYSSKTWYEINSVLQPSARERFSLSQISDQYIFLYGGGNNPLVWLFDINNEEWIEIDDTNPNPGSRFSYTSAQLSEGKVVIFSGPGSPQDTWVFNLSFTKPVIYTSNVSDISETSASFNINLFNGEASTTYTFDYGTATNNYSYSYSNTIAGNSATVNVGFEDSELDPNTQYFVRASATNSVTWTESEEISFWTLIEEPSYHSDVFSHSNKDQSISEIILDFQSLSLNGSHSYIILRTSEFEFEDEDYPADASIYDLENAIGDATVVGLINNLNQTSITFSDLNKNVTYRYSIVPFNIGDDPSTANYLTTDAPVTVGYTIPTLGEWGLISFVILLGVFGARNIRLMQGM